jgi:hypothetical protein
MHAGFSFSYSSISLLLRQPLSIKKSYAGAIQAASDKKKPMKYGVSLIACWSGTPPYSAYFLGFCSRILVGKYSTVKLRQCIVKMA